MTSALQQACGWEIVLDGLTVQERQTVGGYMRRFAFGPRELLFRQGDPSTPLMIVHEGLVRAFHIDADGQQFTSSVGGAGTVLELTAMVLRKPHFLCAESVGPAVVLAMSRANLNTLVARIPRLAANLQRVLATIAMESLLRNGRVIESATVRLAHVLHELVLRVGIPAGGSSYAIYGLTHQDIATMIGASRTWVTLSLGSFERHGVVMRKKGVLLIPCMQRLQHFTAGLKRATDHTKALHTQSRRPACPAQ
jgi:CRP/FNR family cyclic AMP-dependent transcriptional regulator